MIKPIALSLVLLPVLMALAAAQTPPANPPTLRLGLGDLMTMLVQPRHAKLGLGGQARNWDYAAYELHELEEAFERAERAWPRYRTFSITELLGVTKEPMANLDAAIKAKDGAKFDAAYRSLTEACNACHHGTGRAMVVIQFPAATAPYSDQDFTTPKP
jgi:cytochrome c553